MTQSRAPKHSNHAWNLLLGCLLCSLACYEHATALVDLRLRITLSDIEGKPLANIRVRCLDHEVGSPPAPVAAVCVTDARGICSARIRYLYSVRIYPWPNCRRLDRSSGHRFELLAFQARREASLGFLPRLNKAQLFGDHVIHFDARVPHNAFK
jgi:hypothetical protein